jgi:hypothetical protein
MDSLRHQKAVAGTVEEALMNITCENLDNLLAEGDSYSMQIATKHASGCPACMEKLASWNEISDVARGMHATWTDDMLWPRIERALGKEKGHQRTRLWQIAAGLVLLAGMAVVAWKANQRMRAVEFDNAILRASAVDQVEQAEKVHLAAIDHLEKLVEPKLEEASTPLLVSYKEKLMLLDDAIVECQRNIGGNRQNAHLRKQLLAIYSEKQRTLQEVLREESHASNQ